MRAAGAPGSRSPNPLPLKRCYAFRVLRPFEAVYQGRSVFVTGHTGFKGSWLCLWLHRLGARVTGYALEPPTIPNNFTVSGIRESLHDHHTADVRDGERLAGAIAAAQPDVVFHLAAQSVVKRGYLVPRETFETNVIGVASALDAVGRLGRPCSVVVVTSDKCYRNVEQVWGYRESDALGDLDPYGASKGAAEILVRCYRASFFPPERLSEHGIKLASARAGNVVGGGDWTPDALIADIVRALCEGRAPEIRNPRACRPWQHVLQALSGYLTLGARLVASDDPQLCSGWNIGPAPGDELSVREVVEYFIERWGSGGWRDVSDASQEREAQILRLSIDKAIWRLGWKPGWNVRETLRRTVEWYRTYLDDPQNLRELGLRQIESYEEALAGDRFEDRRSSSP